MLNTYIVHPHEKCSLTLHLLFIKKTEKDLSLSLSELNLWHAQPALAYKQERQSPKAPRKKKAP